MAEGDPSIEQAAWPPLPYAWGVVGLLFVAYVFAFIDRQILALLVEPIKQDLDLTDTQIGLLHGFAFVLLYTFMGIPVGRLVDRGNRTRLVGSGIAFWSVMTALCGLATSFWSLFAARVGVGVGEATLTPSAYSLIADYFAPRHRTRAFAVYSLGITMGGGLAWIAGGQLYDWLEQNGPFTLPFGPTLAAWQATFMLVGLPGLLVALAIFAIREPARQGQMNPGTSSGLSLKEAARFCWARRGFYGNFFVGLGLLSIVSYSFVWLPAHFFRTFEWTPGQYGLYAGMITILFGSLGILAAGWIGDALVKRGRPHGAMEVLLGFSTVAVVASALTPLPANPWASLGLLSLSTFFLMAPFGLAPAIIQGSTPNEMRGQVSAVYLFVMNLLGLGLGPTVVALITDRVFADPARTGWSIALVCGLLGPIGVLLVRRAGRHLRQAPAGS